MVSVCDVCARHPRRWPVDSPIASSPPQLLASHQLPLPRHHAVAVYTSHTRHAIARHAIARHAITRRLPFHHSTTVHHTEHTSIGTFGGALQTTHKSSTNGMTRHKEASDAQFSGWFFCFGVVNSHPSHCLGNYVTAGFSVLECGGEARAVSAGSGVIGSYQTPANTIQPYYKTETMRATI